MPRHGHPTALPALTSLLDRVYRNPGDFIVFSVSQFDNHFVLRQGCGPLTLKMSLSSLSITDCAD